MKTITELRTKLNFHPQEINSQIKYFSEKCIIDYDVYLKTKGINLQRDFVWNIHQKRELIWSMLMNRKIPRMAMMNVILKGDSVDGVYQVIDGKQRLSTMIDFYRRAFTLLIDGKEYYFNDLPIDYQRVISGYQFSYYLANEEYNKPFSDEDKINWFMYINFAGTEQDKKHFDKLKK
ncbi:protein of unknown function DUF262 [Cellulophaga phage Nekkels_1]|uniref:GmrSD restriction endonucleases N-terminal domain-containing protein n=1 Tax=Cellulophaga phage Nekkels_1 TaxID=2745692 RepID=A0A8E4UXI1_9CAUD|nr:protein of unknown function DUF262 [Cellulophaga phage Nekkels_1]QQO97063.1 protein of unknown function DUF262 [Cellulophaga phage Nekkels_1]QQO97156.1 protein of unknown function DUF262 [Cellulophaga phage Nekkels_2]